MSGWIKWEKDLEGDLRFKRMVNALMKCRGIAQCNATPYQVAEHVTVLSGALLRLWAHADTYVREDDSLDMTTEELNLYLGVAEFSRICCRDWLGETEDGQVYLPGFLKKNGTEAKKNAQTAKRVARHRMKKRTTVTFDSSNALPLPDQTRPDQTKQDQTRKEGILSATSAHAKNGAAPTPSKSTVTLNLISLTNDQELELQSTYPPGTYPGTAWLVALKFANQHLAAGVAYERILDSFRRYRDQCIAEKILDTKFVRSPIKHCDMTRPLFDEPFPLSKSKSEIKQDANADAVAIWLAQSETNDATP